MFELQNFCFSYPGREVLFDDLSLSLPRSQNCLLQGENGCGKSTLLKILCGKLQPLCGKVKRPARYFYLPQEVESRILGINLSQDLQLWQMAGLDLDMLKSHPLVANFPKVYWELPLRELSQGSKQAYMLSIALCHADHYLLLDEPYPALDKERRHTLTKELSKKRGMLMVSHYRPELSFDSILHLQEGKLL
ncbi:MAG: ABC transporter ATP-binding protein [Candidatus Cloacimonadaceae bacterium]|jgi:ATPase subunit of ABC transporter with duplicated ATPase domains|nr:ABC transporter ATP-binding protein [Candidatus Cloacimonadota bacterium]MDY0128266.1 ABC transporter ATP-binding protein [Candidatus Cloacimonadaceae bacterium]MCB5254019.1 ABC transporter ATP-binding protein [Candidatus Cloacimonadota bacterium]MCK9178897.1 ABC transporter ATP-binding protein [Candidatus Cloacimonadota bacterium]MCK9242995.1 ABC transporter ATP-binding protein [Candidatus Cloacimonadota bacterium]